MDSFCFVYYFSLCITLLSIFARVCVFFFGGRNIPIDKSINEAQHVQDSTLNKLYINLYRFCRGENTHTNQVIFIGIALRTFTRTYHHLVHRISCSVTHKLSSALPSLHTALLCVRAYVCICACVSGVLTDFSPLHVHERTTICQPRLAINFLISLARCNSNRSIHLLLLLLLIFRRRDQHVCRYQVFVDGGTFGCY